MSLLLVGIDKLDLDGKYRLTKLLDVVNPNLVVLNGDPTSFSRKVKSLNDSLELSKEIEGLDDLLAYNQVFSYVESAVFNYLSQNKNSLVQFTNVFDDDSLVDLSLRRLLTTDGVNLQAALDYTKLVLDNSVRFSSDARYGQISALSTKKSVKEPKIYTNSELFSIETTLRSTPFQLNEGVLYLMDAVNLFESVDVHSRIKGPKTHRLYLSDVDSF